MTLSDALKVNELPLKIVHRTHGNITVIGKSTLVRHGMPDDSVYVAEPDDNVSRGPLRVYGSDEVKIWKEPCKHEPVPWVFRGGLVFGFSNAVEANPVERKIITVYEEKCKHCNAKIKAKEWVEV